MDESLLFSEKKHIGFITLNRPKALHALTLPMINEFHQQLSIWKADPDIHAVILQATPSKAFCAGGDIRWLYETGRLNPAQARQFFWHEYKLNHLIYHFGKPYLAFMNGITMGGGVGISLHGSHPIASEEFSFAMPETGIGFFPDIGASHLLTRCPHQTGMYLGLTGERINAMDAMAARLIKHIIPFNAFSETIDALADLDLFENAFEKVNKCLSRFEWKPIDNPDSKFNDAIESCFGAQSVEDILLSLEKLDNLWAEGILENLRGKSPMSLKVTFAQLRKMVNASLADCLKTDFYLASHFMDDHDFFEGVRALIIEKDKSPRWKPQTLSQVTDSMVGGYFEPMFEALEF